ncbi:response regulator [bacterium]|nr:response regulator [bacterium]
MKPSEAARKQVLQSFALEHRDHLLRLEALERELEQGGWEGDRLAEARRALHGLKGTARLLNFGLVEELAHRGETLLLRFDQLPQSERRADWVRALRDALEDSVAAALQGKRSASAERTYRQLGDWIEAEEEDELPRSFEGESEGDRQRQVVRVQVQQLESLIRASGRIGTQPFALQAGLRQLRAQAGPLQSSLIRRLERLAGEMAHSTQELREEARQLLLVPARDLLGGMSSQARDLAQSLGKSVDFILEGGETLVELPLLQALLDPLNHLLSNALHHGLELPEERVRQGKPERGTVCLRVVRLGEQLVVQIRDDGGGLNREVLMERARALGVDPELPSEELVFVDGLSSQSVVGRGAGRGVGMGAVRSRVVELGGSIRWSPGQGSTWELSFSSGAWGIQILTVRCGGREFALPTRAVVRLRYLALEEVLRGPEGFYLVEAGERRPITPLSRLLNLKEREAGTPDRLRVVELGLPDGRSRLVQVEDWLDHLSVTLQAMQGGGWPDGLLEGVYVSPGGEVSMVLRPEFLVQEQEHRPGPSLTTSPATPPLILLVDDSQTTRQMTAALLQSGGYETVEAADGTEALSVLSARKVALVVSDVQMPLLDGLGLLQRIREREEWSEIPVILLTSLAAPEEQKRGLELGADAYLLKQTFDHRRLMDAIQRLL